MSRSAVPWMCSTDVGWGAGHGSSWVAESGPIAANNPVLQARAYDIMPPLLMPVAYTRDGSTATFLPMSATAALMKPTSSTPSFDDRPQHPPPAFHARPRPSG